LSGARVSMSADLKVLGIIPARGGSKGIPRKNLVPLAGKPLLSSTPPRPAAV